MKDYFNYDVIVIGGGHSGAEAAAAAANRGAKTLLVTMNLTTIGQMSCNPAIGGIGKGHIAREIDALGGIMGKVADRTGIQFRMLNQRKGPAVWGPRCQSDRSAYASAVREELEAIPDLYMRQDMVTNIVVEDGECRGVETQLGKTFHAPNVILTSGTFLNGKIHVGEKNFGGGRSGEGAAKGLSGALERLGFETGRLKTGTPPRIDGRTVDFSVMEEQPSDPNPTPFSFMTDQLPDETRPCYVTYTNPGVHDILRTGFERSPMFCGRIEGEGPRYCPSIEDKIERFSDKDGHQIFIEPEGLNTYEMYPNGFSSSLPEEVQFEAMRKVPGLEDVHILRPGYAIEYDYIPPYQIKYNLETKNVPGLFFAGQINGTTGYEEAAAQGIMAGINAVQRLANEEPIVLKRSEAYIGVLIDDLVAKGTDGEPYRMFTSRAEYRILLRQDNADLRLTGLGYELGTVSRKRYERMKQKKEAIDQTKERLENTNAYPKDVNGYLESVGTSTLDEPDKLAHLALRPEVDLADMLRRLGTYDEIVDPSRVMEPTTWLIETDYKYAGYVQRQKEQVEKMKRLESLPIPDDFDYYELNNLSKESQEKLSKIQPDNLGQASRVSGVRSSDVSVLMVMLKKSGADVSRETSKSAA